MDERALLLLGILMVHSQHGYQMNEFIEINLSRVTDMKKSTAYATLDRLADAGYVDVHAEQAGKRPIRKVYAITDKGRDHFLKLLRENLAEADEMKFSSDIGMMFLDHIPFEESLPLLEDRLQKLKTQIQIHESAPQHGFGFGVDLAMEHHLVHLKADYDWLMVAMQRLRASHADENSR
ncbi:PadR family transcriptional regulator [Alicyclobacillus mengziensis]|uniref:PadR family transcriptional regulator n=1 Tax=Alicyclobacillus mengziensis TaxID=2931921 RepID=A0A9X7VYW6_9BACL|nr:PadR family transcriptional regulator [Alicyclobacillus mengziensis]QSO47377.1 PadR family transcriptional regulator [Alicyclobacillus mengziensis]